jgi:hypothetical protein
MPEPEVKTAAKDSTRGYLVMIVVSDQAKTLLFNTDGTFNKEVSKPLHGKFTNVAVADSLHPLRNMFRIRIQVRPSKKLVKIRKGNLWSR